MLTKIAIENFKGIGERVELDLAPITLLFGANSAGKSSIVHALHYAREVLLNFNIDADQTETGGDYIKLGGFNNLLHGRNNWIDTTAENSAREVTIGLTATVSENAGFDLQWNTDVVLFHPHMKKWLEKNEGKEFYFHPNESWFGLSLWKGFESIEFEFTLNDEGLTHVSILANGISVVKFKLGGPDGSGEGGLFGTVELFNFDHPLLPDCFWDLEHAPSLHMPHIPKPWNEYDEDEARRSHEYCFNLLGDEIEKSEEKFIAPTEQEYNSRILEATEKLNEHKREWQRFVAAESSVRENIPNWKKLAEIVFLNGDGIFDVCCFNFYLQSNDLSNAYMNQVEPRQLDYLAEAIIEQNSIQDISIEVASDRIGMSYNAMLFYIDFFVSFALKTIKAELQSFRYLGPIRKTVASSVAVPEYIDPSRWPAGLAAWDRLLQEPEMVKFVNGWITKEDRLYLGCKLERKSVKRFDLDSYQKIKETSVENENEQIIEQIDTLLAGAPEEAELTIKPDSDQFSVHLKPGDVGVGVGQVLPVVVAVLDPDVKMLAIEQPELHLHPRLQAVLGDLLITGALRRGIETYYEGNRFDESVHKREAPIIVETHSEHLILRLLRRIRETTKGTAPPGRELRTDDLAIYYMKNENGNSCAIKIDVDVKGEFIQPWPDDFFELDFYERFS